MRGTTRREFLGMAGAAGAATFVAPMFAAALTRRNDDFVRVGVIGCGGRGTGAAYNALEAHPATRIVAMGDLFADRLEGSLNGLKGAGELASRVEVPDDHKFVGFDAFERVCALDGIDVVVLATPPHFRPQHLEAAVRAGKHVFCEKPVATDPAGIRRVIAAADLARAKKISIVAGTQRRHERCYLDLMKRIGDGQIGDVVAARCYWNQGGLWVHERKAEYSDMEWQCRNWLYFCWLSGDHICEQHVHNLDVVNWALGTPVAAHGMGGRQVRTEPKYGNIFDHFAVEYEYANGVHALSECRQIDGCEGRVEEVLVGTKGTATSRPGFAVIEGKSPWRFSETNGNPYVQEHADLIASIRGDGPYLNEGRRVGESTLTAIMGRMSAYTGKAVSWEFAQTSALDLSPAKYEFGDLPVRPVPVPGRTPLL